MKKFVCLFEDFSKKYFSKKIILLLGLIPRTYFKINKLISDYKLSEIYSPIYQKIEYGGKFFYILLDKTNGGVDRDILLNGVYEADIMKILDENLKVGMNFVDIGSNIGYHSLFVSKIIGPKGKIFSFEPIKRVYNQFEKSISKNKFKNIYAYNFAIGTRNKISKIYIN